MCDMIKLTSMHLEILVKTFCSLCVSYVERQVLRRWRHRWKKSGKETPLVYQQVAKCIEIGLQCQDFDPSKRPFIWDIIEDMREMENVNVTISNIGEYTLGQVKLVCFTYHQ